MQIDCKAVLRTLSSYLDDELPPRVRAAMQSHFSQCRHCRAILDGTKNVVRLIGDERSFDVPAGFSARLFRRVEQ